MIVFRASIGVQNTFISKQSVRGIAISYVLNAGISLGYAKPVYLEVIDTLVLENTIEKYDPEKHPQDDIVGKAPLLRGMFEGKIHPGLLLKGGLNFESAKQANRINAIEVGITLDAYLKKIPIMANEFNHQFLYNLYVAISFGSKKTQ